MSFNQGLEAHLKSGGENLYITVNIEPVGCGSTLSHQYRGALRFIALFAVCPSRPSSDSGSDTLAGHCYGHCYGHGYGYGHGLGASGASNSLA